MPPGDAQGVALPVLQMKNPRGIEGDQRSDANLAGYEGFFVPEETKCFNEMLSSHSSYG